MPEETLAQAVTRRLFEALTETSEDYPAGILPETEAREFAGRIGPALGDVGSIPPPPWCTKTWENDGQWAWPTDVHPEHGCVFPVGHGDLCRCHCGIARKAAHA